MYVCTYVCMYVCLYACMCMYVCMHACIHCTYVLFVCTNIHMCVCVCVCVCVGEGGAEADPGFLGPKAYTILEAILRKRIQNKKYKVR